MKTTHTQGHPCACTALGSMTKESKQCCGKVCVPCRGRMPVGTWSQMQAAGKAVSTSRDCRIRVQGEDQPPPPPLPHHSRKSISSTTCLSLRRHQRLFQIHQVIRYDPSPELTQHPLSSQNATSETQSDQAAQDKTCYVQRTKMYVIKCV